MSKYLYILDNGHGKETKEKESPEWSDGSKLYEYEFNRNVVSYLSYMLRKAGIDYSILVDVDIDIKLSERVKKANVLSKKKESILISVHGNKFTSEKVNGFETHYHSERGKELALIFQNHIGLLGRDRGIKQSNFYIIKKSSMPAVLTENGFYSNEKECKKMLTPEFQYQIALKHFEAIQEIESLI